MCRYLRHDVQVFVEVGRNGMTLIEDSTEQVSITIRADHTLVVAGVDADTLAAWLQAAGKTVQLIDDEEVDAMSTLAEPLSPRETLLLQLIGAGRTNQQIADQMVVSINTVKSYIRTAYQKIGIRTRSEAVRWAIRAGLANAFLDHLGNRESLGGSSGDRT